MTNFATRLKELRVEKGLSQFELAKKLSTSKSTISMYEQGRRTPSYEGLEEMADYFNVDMDYLMGRSDYTTRIVKYDSAREFASPKHEILYKRMRNASEKELEKLEKMWDLIADEEDHMLD